MYPISYQTEIQQAATDAHVEPLLVASVIRVESKFKKADVSHAGAVGLMQLMPQTAQWIEQQAKQANDNDAALNHLRDASGKLQLDVPSVNIQLGSWYIHYLMIQFNGNQVAAIAAYNAGPKRVGQWLKSGQWNGQLDTITDIPVGETRHFVDRVFYNYALYQRIYANDKNLTSHA
jgi:soluble lytic murein transglycosylase